ncbi:ankyrin repeat-containing domain protein [Tirmania nivea]|nr:ankyrin repeat-containing domain protein [Tirmania nivea]
MDIDVGLELLQAVREGQIDRVSLLLERGVNANAVVDNTTALNEATWSGDQEIVSLLLDRCTDVNMVVGCTTALITAAWGGHPGIVLLLLDRGVDVNMVVADTTALVVAAKEGNQDIASLLLNRGAHVDMVVHNTTALIAAVEKGQKNIGMVRLLLDRGADVNMVAVGHTTALIAAIEQPSRNTEMVRLLLDRGADALTNNMALMEAVNKGRLDVVSLLLDRGAEVNNTALMLATKECHRDIVSLLLSRGGSVNAVVHDTTALIVAVKEGSRCITSLLLDRGADVNMVVGRTTALIAAIDGQIEVVRLLLDRGADPDAVVNNTTALIIAVEKGDRGIVSQLGNRGIDVGSSMSVGHTDNIALMWAMQQWHRNIVSLLLDRCGDVNMVVGSTTALIVAVKEGNRNITSLLLDRGANVNMVVHDTTALVVAVKEGNRSIASLLLDRGANVNMVVSHTTALSASIEGQKQNIEMVRLLLNRGADANTVLNNATALIMAVRKGRRGVILLLVREGADINMQVDGTTALIAAVCVGNQDIMLLLLRGGADVNMQANGGTALIAAVEKRDRGIVSLLLDRGADVNVVAHDTTALIAAIQGGHQDVMPLLLDRGADVNVVAHDTTALIAAIRGGHQDVVSWLLDRGADVNVVAHDTTALIAAARGGHLDVVSLLLDRSAEVNLVAHDTTALITAIRGGHQDVMSRLLDRGADVNVVAHDTTALFAAIRGGHQDVVSLLLNGGADVNMVAHDTTALVAAIRGGHQDAVSLLLRRGADVNVVAYDTTALIAAIRGGHWDVVSRLLDRGADVNVVAHDTTALIAAARGGHLDVVSLLLNRGVEVNVVAHDTTALIAAIEKGYKNIEVVRLLLDTGADLNIDIVAGQCGRPIPLLQFTGQTDCNKQDTVQSSSEWHRTFLDKPVVSKNYINAAEHRTPLTAAISKGNLQLLRLLVERGGDVRLGDSCGTAVRAALAAEWDSKRLSGILRYLVGKGADINIVSSQRFGTALGQAVYMGATGLASLLLLCGADRLHVGGTYNRTALAGAYPTALDAALSLGSKAQSDLIAELSLSRLQRSPPFPMPYTRPGSLRRLVMVAKPDGSTCPCLDEICKLPVHATLTTQQADISCRTLQEEIIIQLLVQLVIGTGTNTPEIKRYEDWIRNDVRYFVAHGYDLGEAYAAARVGWRHFNKPDFVHLVAQHRGQWHGIAQKIDRERDNSINRNDAIGQEMIEEPYKVMPRRLWDLKSNRVVEFRMLHSELLAYKSTTERQLGKAQAEASHVCEIPVYWAISHSWESSMNLVQTSINQYQWQVPLPHGLDLDHDVRRELLSYGIEYVWLDVLCLRQRTTSNLNPSNSQISGSAASDETTSNMNPSNSRISGLAASDETRIAEWKLDVPTIGNIYRGAQGIVRYFNGLGRPFRTVGWDNNAHWLQRIWTLQEIKAENSTINGGIAKGFTPPIMNACGMMAGQVMTLRCALRPVLKLAADVDSPSGCSLYALAREISKRNATQNTDKVTALEYLLRLTKLPTYDENLSDNHAWARCFHMLPLDRKIELLFDYPYRSEKQQQWFPTWNELMMWPAVNPHCDYSPTVHVQTKGYRHLGVQDLADLKDSKEVPAEGSLFMPDLWALLHCHVTLGAAQGVDDEVFETNYEVRARTNVYDFYNPYISQKPIETMSPTGSLYEFTIATADLGHSNNWVVCRLVKKLKTRCIWDSTVETCEYRESHQCSSDLEIEVYVLRKVGVLRTDSYGEILAGTGTSGGDSTLRRIHALFV